MATNWLRTCARFPASLTCGWSRSPVTASNPIGSERVKQVPPSPRQGGGHRGDRSDAGIAAAARLRLSFRAGRPTGRSSTWPAARKLHKSEQRAVSNAPVALFSPHTPGYRDDRPWFGSCQIVPWSAAGGIINSSRHPRSTEQKAHGVSFVLLDRLAEAANTSRSRQTVGAVELAFDRFCAILRRAMPVH